MKIQVVGFGKTGEIVDYKIFQSWESWNVEDYIKTLLENLEVFKIDILKLEY